MGVGAHQCVEINRFIRPGNEAVTQTSS
eukprot:COSAG03_NODE_14338_length_468_cov_0.560976_1_plen_27_part_10